MPYRTLKGLQRHRLGCRIAIDANPFMVGLVFFVSVPRVARRLAILGWVIQSLRE